tara:strand:+ start:2513 stop:3520 length:1008 start_codon:yes stop_codon:yes gene_type:complete
MYVCSDLSKNNSINSNELDKSEYIPEQYIELKNKKFYGWEIAPWEIFIFKDKILGEGSFAKVYLAKWRETLVVAKVINEDICDTYQKEFILRETDIMSKLHHPNIVQYLGYVDEPFIIIMEYIPNKNLLENICSLKKNEKIPIMKDILQGLAYFHNRRPQSLIHRDIKPTNILLTQSKRAKITDFGISKLYNLERKNSFSSLEKCRNSSETDNELTNDVGTLRYRAPETFLHNYKYNYKVDIYSCGILLYEMFEKTRYIPKTEMKWKICPSNVKDIIKENMLCENPENRLDSLTLLKRLNSLINKPQKKYKTYCVNFLMRFFNFFSKIKNVKIIK